MKYPSIIKIKIILKIIIIPYIGDGIVVKV